MSIRNTATSAQRDVTTDGTGRFSAPLLEPGPYEVTVTAAGFGRQVNRGYTLTLGQTLNAPISLSVAAAAEVVTVEAQAPVVEPGNFQTTALVNTAQVENLPLNGRRFLDLAQLTPGVMVEPERGQISFAGARGINSSVNIDGTNFNEPFFGGQAGGERSNSSYVVSQAAVEQFQVIRGTFDAEYGRTTAGMVNVITKSGTNTYHGEVFNYLRLKGLSPTNAFGDRVATFRDQYGASVGGPVLKDRLFFFAVYDGQQENIPGVIRFGGNTTGLPESYLAKQGTFESTNDINTFLGKVDWQLTNKHRISFRYNQSGNTALNGTFPGSQTGELLDNGTEQDFSKAGVINATSSFTPTLLNELRFQYRIEDRPRVNNGEGMDFVSKAGPQTSVSGCCYFGGVSYLPIPVTDSTTQVSNVTSWIHGSHSLKFGVDINRYHSQETFRGNWRGVYTFYSLNSFLNVINGKPGAVPDQFRMFFGDGQFDAVVNTPAAFIQDQWRIGRRVTLSYGMRYSASIMPTPPRPNPDLPLTGQIPSDLKEFQPRVGLSVDVFGDGKTVFRTGAGIFYADTPGLLLNQAYNSNGNPNVGVTFTLNASQIKAVQAVHPEFVYPFVPDSSSAANSSYFTAANLQGVKPDASFFAPDFRNPRSFNFTMGLERQIGQSISVGFDYVHVNTVHLERLRDINFFPPVEGLDSAKQLRPLFNTSVRPNAKYGRLLSQESSARANYDGLTLSINKRMSRNLMFNLNGTLAWSRDDDSNERNYAGTTYTNAYCLECEYSWSRDDIRRRMVGSILYNLPFGFQISGIMTWRSGLPLSAMTGTDSNKDGNSNDRPIIGGFELPRNSFRQPNYWNTDMRVSKVIRIRERHRVELIADLFNVFNHENWTYSASSNETGNSLGQRWGTGQTPLPTFMSIQYLNSAGQLQLNNGGAYVSSPFQAQFALRYMF